MKSILKSLMSVAAAALALTSCSTDAAEEVILKGERKPLKVNATIDRTRTSLAADHVNLEWSEGDTIKLYIGESATENDVITHKIGGEITAAYNEGDKVFACYTSYKHDYNSKDVTAVNIEIPKEQKQTEANVFAGQNLPMVAQGTIKDGKVDLTFKPVGCVLVFNVYGPAGDEKIQSIKFETSVGCCGYSNCDLTAETLVYEPYKNNTLAAVTLATSVATGTSKPTDTKKGENQIYLVVAPVNYPAGSKFIVTTDAGKTFTFVTSNDIDCSQNTARVVNLNLANAAEMQPAIEVPTISQLSSDKADGLVIENIVFKNIATAGVDPADIVGVYSDPDLATPLENSWLTITANGELFASGKLYYNVAANDTAEDRTAYIGIKCAGVQAVIAITQVAKGASTDKYYVKVTSNLEDWTGEYLIVYEDGAKALNGGLTDIDVADNVISIEITQQGVLSNETTNASLVKISKLESSTDEYKYIMQASSSYYLYSSNNKKNTLDSSTTYSNATKNPNSISVNGGSVTIQSKTTSKVLRFNAGTNSGNRFRYYKSTSTDTNLKSIQLYKLQE